MRKRPSPSLIALAISCRPASCTTICAPPSRIAPDCAVTMPSIVPTPLFAGRGCPMAGRAAATKAIRNKAQNRGTNTPVGTLSLYTRPDVAGDAGILTLVVDFAPAEIGEQRRRDRVHGGDFHHCAGL